MALSPDLCNLPQGFTFIRSFQGIHEFHLANGLTLLLLKEPSQANVTVNITYLVGSRHEGRGEAGMAHLLEHMLFRRTKSCQDIKALLQERGANFNATTWYDRTNYFETLSPSLENLEFALKLEADRMINTIIVDEDLTAEMTVVRNEFEMGENNPVHVLHDQMMSAAYLWHNYGKTTIGNRSDIERVPAKALRVFYENYYQPDNAVLIVAGQFDEETALKLVDKHYSGIPKPQRTLDPTYTQEPAQDGPRTVRLLRAGDMPSVAVGYHIPAARHEDFAPIKVLIDCLTDEPAGSLYQHYIKSGRSSELFGMVYALFEPGMAFVFCRPSSPDEAEHILSELPGLLEKNHHEQVSLEAIERIKKRLKKRMKIALSNSKDLCLKLSESIAAGDWRLFFWGMEQINRITKEDVDRVFDRYFIESNRTSGIFLPLENAVRASIPSTPLPDFSTLIEHTSVSQGEDFVADPENIEKLVTRKEITQAIKMAFLPKKSRGQTVSSALTFRFSDEASLAKDVHELQMVPAMLWRGAGKMDYQGIRDSLDSSMSTLDIGGGVGSLTVFSKSDKDNFASVLDLLTVMINEPTFDEHEFSLVVKREVEDLEESKNDPQKIAYVELDRLKNPWPKDSIHYVESIEEKIAVLRNLSVNNVAPAFARQFNTNHVDCGLVGDTDGAFIAELLAKKFPSKSGEKPYQRIVRPFIPNVPDELVLDTPDKEMAIITCGANFAMKDSDADFPSIKLINYLFGENMNSRLTNRIREKMGLSYGAGSWLEMDRFDPHASVNLYALVAPQNVSEARKAMVEEWQKLVKEGVFLDELNQFKDSIYLTFLTMLGNDSYLAHALSNDFESGRTFHFREELFRKIKQLTIKDLQDAMDRWFAPLQFSWVIAGDKAKIR